MLDDPAGNHRSSVTDRGVSDRGVSAAGTAPAAVSPAASSAARPGWTTPMRITRRGGCMLYPSLRGKTSPITTNAWRLPRGARVGWRYRVSTRWSLVLDFPPAPAGRSGWAFLATSCLKSTKHIRNRYPAEAKNSQGRVRHLWGKASRGWRQVVFGTSRAGGVHPTGIRRIDSAWATLRDRPGAFATGDLFRGDRFRITGRRTGRSTRSWIYGQAVGSGRWGWVQCGNLRGNPCTPSAAQAASDPPTAPPPSATALPGAPPAAPPPGSPVCHWKVTWPTAGVYEDPARDHGLLKTKRAGEVVGPYCTTHHNTAENDTYVMVQTAAAADGIGWMRRPALNPT